MSDDLHELERQVEGELSRWSALLDAAAPAEAVRTARLAVRQELGQAWFAAQGDPPVSPVAVARTHAVVRAELAACSRGGTAARRGRWRRWYSSQGLASLSAAAMILVCAGIVRWAGQYGLAQKVDDNGLLAGLTMWDPGADSLLLEMDALESDVAAEQTPSPAEGESLEDVVQDMDRILEQHDPAQPASGGGVPG